MRISDWSSDVCSSELRGKRAMAANKKLLILPGDGIGPEVMAQVRRVIDWVARKRSLGFDLDEGLVGGAAIDAEGAPISDATMDKAMRSEEHTSELQSLMRNSYAVFCLKKKINNKPQ